MFGLLAVAAAASGCGSSGGSHYQNLPRPATPVNLTVYINDHRVSVSPSSVGAGPVELIVTNQASGAETLQVLPAGTTAAQPVADTGPISPQATTQVTVNLNSPGNYTVGSRPASTAEANTAAPTGIQPAVVHVGRPRASASNQLLQP